MADYIVIGIVMILVFGASFFLYKRKKMEGICFGCPHAKFCGGNCDKKEEK